MRCISSSAGPEKVTSTPRDICRLSALTQAQLIRERSLTSTETVEAYLRRIDQLNERVHAYVRVFSQTALSQARMLDREAQEGRFRGPLHGVPYAAKDLIRALDVDPGAAPFGLARSVECAKVVSLLDEAGLVLIGKTTTYELAMGPPSSRDKIPPARNPWDLDHIPGGSSSGSAAATAALMCPIALGTDTGGSVRHPAALSGVVGLKPSYGAVSLEGVALLSWTLDHVGVLTESVADARAMLRVLAPALPEPRVKPSKKPLAGITVILPSLLFDGSSGASSDVMSAFHESTKLLESLGARVAERRFPIRHQEDVLSVILLSEAAALHRDHYFSRPADFGESFRERLAPGYLFSAVDYLRAQAIRAEMMRSIDESLDEQTVIATPTMPTTATSFEDFERLPRDLAPPPFTSLFSLTGSPAISIPNGMSTGGLPIGLQMAARWQNDHELLRVAEAVENSSAWNFAAPIG